MERGERRWGEAGGREKGKWGCNSWEVEGSAEYMYVVHTFITLTHVGGEGGGGRGEERQKGRGKILNNCDDHYSWGGKGW